MASDDLIKRALAKASTPSGDLALRTLLAADEAETKGFIGVAEALRRIARMELADDGVIFGACVSAATPEKIVHRN